MPAGVKSKEGFPDEIEDTSICRAGGSYHDMPPGTPPLHHHCLTPNYHHQTPLLPQGKEKPVVAIINNNCQSTKKADLEHLRSLFHYKSRHPFKPWLAALELSHPPLNQAAACLIGWALRQNNWESDQLRCRSPKNRKRQDTLPLLCRHWVHCQVICSHLLIQH